MVLRHYLLKQLKIFFYHGTIQKTYWNKIITQEIATLAEAADTVITTNGGTRAGDTVLEKLV